MIISPGRKFIFVHIPKTGGTSMALALEARAMKDDMMLGDTPKAKKRRRKLQHIKTRGRLWKHSTLADIDGLVSTEDMHGYFCFTLVRNPWDRVVSYYHWLQDQTFDHPAVALSQSLPFCEFACHDHTRKALKESPARRYVTDATGKERATTFVRLEHLAEDLAPVEAHLGFSLNLQRTNSSEREVGWRHYYNEESLHAVGESCREDIARFGYRVETVSAKYP